MSPAVGAGILENAWHLAQSVGFDLFALYMNDRYLKRLLFWALAIVPFWFLFIIRGTFGAYWFVSFLLIYALIYRPIIHIFRLLDLNRIEEKDAWKFFIPFYDTRYLRSIWLG